MSELRVFIKDQCTEYRNPVQSLKEKKMNSKEDLCRIAMLAVPHLIFLVVYQEEPAELHNQRAAVGDSNIADHLSVIQDTAKIQLHSLKAEVRVMHFTTKFHSVYLRVLHIFDCQSFFCHPVVQIISVGRVKFDQQVFFFTNLQVNRLQTR